MTYRDPSRNIDRREFIRRAGAVVGGAILLPYGCSESESGVTDSGPPTQYTFFRIMDSFSPVLPKAADITPGIMINDAGRILFYGDLGDDNYALFELFMDYTASGPVVREAQIVVETGQGYDGGPAVQRINRADTNGRGDISLVLDFRETGTGPAEPAELPAVFLRAENRLQRILSFGDEGPDGAMFGGALGDLAINNDRDLLLVSHYVSAEKDFGHGVFSLPQASLTGSRLLQSSGTALQGRNDAFVRGFGLIDRYGGANYLAQTQIAAQSPLTAGGGGPGSGSVGSLLQGNAQPGLTAAPARVLSAPQTLRLESEVAGEIIMGPRAGADNAAAWIAHSPDGEQQRLFFSSNARPVSEIANTLGDPSIFSLSAPVLSGNGTLSYLQINNDEQRPPELKMVGADAPETVLRVGDMIDGQAITGLMYGYHSRQADEAGRIVVYAEFGEGEPAILVGIPA